MVSVLTGDIINSKEVEPSIWLPSLREVLALYAKETEQWEIFRGDSFQVEVKLSEALILAFRIKLAIKKFERLDVRIAIGLGEMTYMSNKITESNGTAFINSGMCFENLKKKTLAVKSPNKDFDYTINTMIQLASLTMNNWTVNSVKLIKVALDNPELNQKQIAKLLDKSQSTISEGLKRSGFEELKQLLNYYEYKVNNTRW